MRDFQPVRHVCLFVSGNPNGATELINRWVADNTAQKITNILPPGALDSFTRLVLVNAVYFKGDWAKKFEVSNTKEENFHVSSTEKVRVQLMHMHKAKFSYGSNHELISQAIELPYAGNRLSMIIILPDPSSSLQKLESLLTADDILNVRDKFQMYEREVQVWLPRFRLNEKLDLTGILSAMGMTDMFSTKLADFSGMDGTRELCVSKVLHQAVVDVNEEGTEAAAVTAVVMMKKCLAVRKDPFEFRADRPFLFFIRDNSTNSILFLGRLVRPDSAS
jgi:serpin B